MSYKCYGTSSQLKRTMDSSTTSASETAKATSPTTTCSTRMTAELPSKQDRLFLYHELERIVHRRIRSLQYLPDTRPTNWRGRVLKDDYPEASTVGLRGRQIDYMRMELLPILSASLLLPLADLLNDPLASASTPTTSTATTVTGAATVSDTNTRTTTTTSTTVEGDDGNDEDNTASNGILGESNSSVAVPSSTKAPIADPIGCISLLLSNIMFLSKGNYDARIRHVVKMACVGILQDMCHDQSLPQVSSARALYSITKEHANAKAEATIMPSNQDNNNSYFRKKKSTSNDDDVDEGLEEIVFNSAVTLPLTPTQVAKERFETLEKTIATDILQALMAQEIQRQQEAEAADRKSVV